MGAVLFKPSVKIKAISPVERKEISFSCSGVFQTCV
jgi:hypothetical protein